MERSRSTTASLQAKYEEHATTLDYIVAATGG
jgi:hypothetical protein